jgi:probable F420-dependent oxidoreductase
MSPRPFRFGVQASRAKSGAEWTELARRVEASGYATLTMPDHFDKQLAPVPALAAAAAVTTTLRVGALVWDNDYKHPLVLAKELATMDVLSEGRLEIGIGAGWMRTDYDQAGMAYDPPGVRVSRFEEALAVMKGLFADGPFSFEGEHYRITGHEGFPPPVQRPHPPFLIGAGGPRMLRIAAREADIVGINFTLTGGAVDAAALESGSREAVETKLAGLRDAAGSRWDDIELNIRAFVVQVTEDRDTAAEQFASLGLGFTPEQVLEWPFALIGSVHQIVETLIERRETHGFSYVIVGAGDVDAFAPVVAELAGR